MKRYNSYITIRRFNGSAICGEINIPYGTTLNTAEGFLVCPKGLVCAVTSQNAYDYFSQDDDGCGLERGELVQDILRRLHKLKKHDERNAIIWGKIWADVRCQKYRRPEHADHWLWNYDFYNAEVDDLKYIRNLIMRG